MIVPDASFFIALFRRNDQLHGDAHALMMDLESRQERMVTTTHVVEETVTYIFSRDGSDAAFKVVETMLGSKNLAIEPVSLSQIRQAAAIMRKYRRLSLCDSLSVVLFKERGASRILSFDRGFDLVQGVKRLH